MIVSTIAKLQSRFGPSSERARLIEQLELVAARLLENGLLQQNRYRASILAARIRASLTLRKRCAARKSQLS